MSARAIADAERFRTAGYWLDTTFHRLLDEVCARTPNKLAIVADRVDRDQPRRFSYAELGQLTARVAASLRSRGVVRGDVVTLQLPNWWEFVVTALACSRIGAIANPVTPILRERELSFILNLCQSKVFIVPKVYRGFDYKGMAVGMRHELPHLRHLVVVDDESDDGFERMLLANTSNSLPDADQGSDQLAPDDAALLMFTSGTTGEPKGVMHSSNSLVGVTRSVARRLNLTAQDVLLVASPVGHATGYVAAVLQSIYLGATMVLQDMWNARAGVALMEREGVTYTVGATPFLTDICDAVANGAPKPSHLKTFLCAGAPIPPALIDRALQELGLTVCSMWGMTEALAATLTEPSRAATKSSTTDGRPVEGMEVRVADGEGNDVPTGQPGRLLVRGSQMFMGYYRRPELSALDADGWFDSGDLAYMDSEGYIRISGRLKEMVIRGGENVPIVEIENLLYKHPAVASVAIVGYPDVRLGERACAFITTHPGAQIDLAEMQNYLSACRVAKQFWPERLVLMPDLPRTASGKIQKFKLKEIARSFGNAS